MSDDMTTPETGTEEVKEDATPEVEAGAEGDAAAVPAVEADDAEKTDAPTGM